jgi:hypothetical protein
MVLSEAVMALRLTIWSSRVRVGRRDEPLRGEGLLLLAFCVVCIFIGSRQRKSPAQPAGLDGCFSRVFWHKKSPRPSLGERA